MLEKLGSYLALGIVPVDVGGKWCPLAWPLLDAASGTGG